MIRFGAKPESIYLEENSMADKDDKKDEKICKNPPCGCPATQGSKYCGPSCEGTGSFIELDCDCGHEECTGNF